MTTWHVSDSSHKKNSRVGRDAIHRLSRFINAILKVFLGLKKCALSTGSKDSFRLENYRCISLLTGLAKLMEIIVKKLLNEYFKSNQLLETSQLRFRRRLEAILQGAHFHAFVIANIKPKGTVVAKAFDKECRADFYWRWTTLASTSGSKSLSPFGCKTGCFESAVVTP